MVYSAANYSLLAPPHSYINALDYTPQELADYLDKLNRNDTLYNEYFWWKDHYKVEVGIEQMARHAFCDLCRKLHQDEGIVQIYEDMGPEWSWDTQCFTLPAWRNATNAAEIKRLFSIFQAKLYLKRN